MQIKTLKDYYEQLYKMFPDVPKEDIKKICSYGWKCLYLYNSAGADTIIKDNNFWCYIGYLKQDSLKYFKYYIKKLATKLRLLYKRKKVTWNGKYYFALTEQQYQYYLSQQNSRGRKRKNFNFKGIMLYQLLDECKICEHEKKYIFEIPYISDIGFKVYIENITTDKAKLIITRDPLKFKDILINDNEYELL